MGCSGRAAATAALLLISGAAPALAQVRAGGEAVVNTYTTGGQVNAGVAVVRDGSFVVAWEGPRDGSGDAVGAQRFNGAGARVGGELQVNTYTLAEQERAAVAAGRDGRFVAVWESYGQDGSSEGVFAQRYDAGGARVGGEFRVNTGTTATDYAATVAVQAGGGFVVTWSSYVEGAPFPDGSGSAVLARRYDAAGTALGAEFVVNSGTLGYQSFSYVAAGPAGSFVVVWESDTGDGDTYGVFGQRFDASGLRLGGEFRVNSYTTGAQFSYNVSIAADGRFVVAWGGSDAMGAGAFVSRFSAAGARLGADLQVNTSATGVQIQPHVAADDNFNFVVAWTDSNADGSEYGVRARRFTAAGTARGAEFVVNTFTTGAQQDPSVSADPAGNFVVAWEGPGQDGSSYGVVLQRFGGLFPRALAVDTGGDLVWEPGETVDVRPSWQNLNGASQAVGGTFTLLTGPAGPTYTITDATGSYGTLPSGATQACTDCYGVMVSNPAPRPATHWDASVAETLTPDGLGQSRSWLLHVGRSFVDVPSSSGFYRFIEVLLHNGVTGGCNATSYCPAFTTTREQMSVFVLVAKEGAGYLPPACGAPLFADVPAGNPFCRFIEELARRGVVSGCGGNNYCPASAVTREQMAIFVLRTLDPALNPPACGTPVFADVPAASPFCRWIEELARRNVVTGCGGGNYCPQGAVTREQMGVFISLTFGLTLY
jgi:hypothetical protein